VSERAVPGWFGPADQRGFGWYHAPARPSREIGIVLCPSLGYEFLCTYRAHRLLAEKLAGLGFPVLRFDYPGTGEAPGTDLEPGRVPAWRLGVGAAVAELRERSGRRRVVLVGMRMGASLAASVAAERGDVEALVLVAPCVSGGTFLREMRIMQKMRGRTEARPFDGQQAGDEEAIGFVFRAETIAALSKVDFRKLEGRPARRALVIPRDDMPELERPVIERLRALGCDVDLVKATGYAAAMTEDPYFAEVPTRIWEAVADWLVALAPAQDRPDALAPDPSRARLDVASERVGEGAKETPLQFGDGGRLFGLLDEPAGRRSALAVILLNTGAHPRTGACRFGVTLSRSLATRGVAALRMDISGLGDSPPQPGRKENVLYAAHAVEDVRAAMDALEARGFRRFILAGLCAGGYTAFRTALGDARASALVMMNPRAFEWREGDEVERRPTKVLDAFQSIRFYRQQALRMDTWRRLAAGKVNVRGIAGVVARYARGRTATAFQHIAVWLGREDWVTSDLARKFGALLDRGARVLLVFSSDEAMLDHFNREMGPVAGRLRARGLNVEIVEGGDHVFAPVWTQELVTNIITGFVTREAS
jgi:pimeloyl-ACP methyl ester carboxylesterase